MFMLIRLTITLLGILITTHIAVAGPPFTTDDPEPVDYQHWEFYTASQLTHNTDGWSGTSPQFELNYGPIQHLQLGMTVPAVSFVAPSDGPTQVGYGDTEFGAKYQFVEETDSLPKIAAFPHIDVPTGDQERGLGTGSPQYFLPLWFQKSLGPWTTYGGGGYSINPGEGNQNSWFLGWLVQHQITSQFTLGAEIFHQTSKVQGGESNTKFNVGAIVDFSKTYHLLVSAGHSIQGPNEFQAYIAFLLTFGPEKPSGDYKMK